MMTAHSINPYSGKMIASFTTHSPALVAHSVENCHEQFLKWRQTSFMKRANLIRSVAKNLLDHKQEYANIITSEMGKPIAQSLAEIEKCTWLCEYYAENAESQLRDMVIPTDAYKSYIRHEPLGVILAVMPWNYPFWQVFRFAIPALMAGNVAVLKHASNVFGSAMAIESVFRTAGFPEYCFKTLLVGSDGVAEIIKHPLIKAITLTGSGAAGSSVAAVSGKHVKKTVLELGGSNALIVLKDCNLDKTVETCVAARFQNTGQSCIAGKRLLIDVAIFPVFMEKLLIHVARLKSGDPLDIETYIGPLARTDLAETLQNQVERSLAMGAKLEIGGKHCDAYFEPTVISNVSPEMPLFIEETFGPVLSVTTFSTIEEAVQLSNASHFGLGVSIFTENVDAIETLLPHFEEGAVFVNDLVKSDPRLPFGGIKQSGYGRELGSLGIKEFVNVKTVYIKK
jgi:succinate-semialdehyde dehydrogenase / glutarate-semialdehyde dehydrogenase